MMYERPEDVPETRPFPQPTEGRTIHKDAETAEYLGPGITRTFITGATRDTDEGKYDYEGFLSPRVLERYGEYMNKHRVQRDGKLRDSDNWQKGIPRIQYIKSLFRHFIEVWGSHREGLDKGRDERREEVLEEALCAMLFNTMGYLHEVLRGR